MVLTMVQGLGPDSQYGPQEISINPYSEIDIAYGSTLIILITSNHFRMTQTWMLFPGHYGQTCIHTVYSFVLKGPPARPPVPLAKSTTELSKIQACFINMVITTWVNIGRHS